MDKKTSSSRRRIPQISTNSALQKQIVPFSNKSEDKKQIATYETNSQNENRNNKDSILGVFSVRRPKHFGSGVASGIKSVAKGVGLGITSLFAMPIIGASTGGVTGFIKGVCVGTVGVVALPTTGICVAGVQIMRGLYNTPVAVIESSQGKTWDRKEREWRVNWFCLDEEYEDMMKIDELIQTHQLVEDKKEDNKPKNVIGSGKKVKDTALYDVLEVSPDADQIEIRKQYYKLARKYHPDKTGAEPEANEKFKKIGEAYQVLSDEERKKAYDEFGTAAQLNMPLIDSSLFFMMLFGSEEFEPYIGQLRMAIYVEMSSNANKLPTEEAMEFAQHKREIQLALNLKNITQYYIDILMRAEFGENYDPHDRAKNFTVNAPEKANDWREKKVHNDMEHFNLTDIDAFHKIKVKLIPDDVSIANGMRADFTKGQNIADMKELWINEVTMCARKLVSSSYGSSLLEAIGWTYANCAAVFLGKEFSVLGLGGRYAELQATTRGIQNNIRTVNAAVKAVPAARRIQKAEARSSKKTDDSDKSTAADTTADAEKTGYDDSLYAETKSIEDAVPLILETMLQICLMDVEQTVRIACRKFLKDMSVSISVRKQRASAVAKMGAIFMDTAVAYKKEHKSSKMDARQMVEDAFIRAHQKADEAHQKNDSSSTYNFKPEEYF